MHLNKTALAEEISKKVGVSKKEAEDMIEAFVSIVTNTLKNGGSVGIAGFGAFSAKTRAGRIGVNPQNPSEKINIPPVTVSKFKAGLALKKALKEKDSTDTTTTETAPAQESTSSQVEPTSPSPEPTTEPTVTEEPTTQPTSTEENIPENTSF